MLKQLANIATALTLMLSASAATPALAGGSHDDRKCTGARHAHAKRIAAPPARKASPDRGVMIVEKRKMDVQILSFGP